MLTQPGSEANPGIVKLMQIKSTAYGRAAVAGSAILASCPVGIAIRVAVGIENRT